MIVIRRRVTHEASHSFDAEVVGALHLQVGGCDRLDEVPGLDLGPEGLYYSLDDLVLLLAAVPQ